jgi:hypothetical protein
MCKLDRVLILSTMGSVGRARELRPELDQAPPGDYFALQRAACDLSIAFHLGAVDTLPDDETLYEWAKQVLATNQWGVSAVMLAWAFRARGDEGMAAHMLEEAPARLHGNAIEQTFPEVAKWWHAR